MKIAKYYSRFGDKTVKCELCPHNCKLSKGKYGICRVRMNRDGDLYSETYGKLTSIALDPIEKKPLYHFYPTSKVLSLGSFGCTMRCEFCQNEQISQCQGYVKDHARDVTPPELKNMYQRSETHLVAFTYNEPVVSFEYIIDITDHFEDSGAEFAMISNGYINKEPLKELTQRISAFNIDLKAFQEDFYKRMTYSKLQPVLDSLETIKRAGRHLEITYLVIPGLNDQSDVFSEMIRYLKENLGEDQVLHISRYFPHFKVEAPPTPIEKIKEFVEIASKSLNYVYAGNTGNALPTTTICPECNSELIRRDNYHTTIVGLKGNACNNCGKIIKGIFKNHDS